MNKLFFTGTGVALLILGLSYYRQAQTKAREQLVEMESALRETEARAVAAEQRGDNFRQQFLQVEAENLSHRQPVSPRVITNTEQPTAKLFRDPAIRSGMKKEHARALERTVRQIVTSNLLEQLNLTPEQEAKFRELVMKKHAGDTDLTMALMTSGELSNAQLAQAGHAARDQRENADAEIRAFLGEGGYQLYAWQEDSLSERSQLKEVRSKIAEAGAPLTAEQEDALLRAMYEERSTTRFTHDFHNPHSFDMDRLPEIFSEESLDRFITEMEQMNNRIILRAQAILDPRQSGEFAQAIRDHFEQSKMTVKMTAMLFPVRPRN
jgi:hypothetical protein